MKMGSKWHTKTQPKYVLNVALRTLEWFGKDQKQICINVKTVARSTVLQIQTGGRFNEYNYMQVASCDQCSKELFKDLIKDDKNKCLWA